MINTGIAGITRTLITPENTEIITPLDMQREVTDALTAGRETSVEYVTWRGDDGSITHYCYFAAAGRGAVAEGADSQWTDAADMDDLLDRWAEDRMVA